MSLGRHILDTSRRYCQDRKEVFLTRNQSTGLRYDVRRQRDRILCCFLEISSTLKFNKFEARTAIVRRRYRQRECS